MFQPNPLLGVVSLCVTTAFASRLQFRALDAVNISTLNVPFFENDIYSLQTLSSGSPSLSVPALVRSSAHNLTSTANTDVAHKPTMIKCDGYTYGFHLSASSCQEAWSLMPKSTSFHTCEILCTSSSWKRYFYAIHSGTVQGT